MLSSYINPLLFRLYLTYCPSALFAGVVIHTDGRVSDLIQVACMGAYSGNCLQQECQIWRTARLRLLSPHSGPRNICAYSEICDAGPQLGKTAPICKYTRRFLDPYGMWSPKNINFASIAFIYLISFVNISNAGPFVAKNHDTRQSPEHLTTGISITTFNSAIDTGNPPLSTFNHHPALSIRAPYSTDQNRNVTFLSFAVSLVPSKAHAALLSKMYTQIYQAASNALDTIAPLLWVAFTLGMFTLTINSFGGHVLANILLQIIQDVWISTHPISFSLLWFGLEGFCCYVDLTFNDAQRAAIGI